VSLFAKRSTPSDCMLRISNAMKELELIRDLIDTTPKGKDYPADWDANRDYADRHLNEAWSSLGAALHGLVMSGRRPTRDEAETVAGKQGKLVEALCAEVKRLDGVAALAEARAAAAEAVVARHAQSGGGDAALRLRRIVMGAVHPDKARSAAEGEWRTRLCQTLFSEMDQVVRSA
jgi:hypothetical protein